MLSLKSFCLPLKVTKQQKSWFLSLFSVGSLFEPFGFQSSCITRCCSSFPPVSSGSVTAALTSSLVRHSISAPVIISVLVRASPLRSSSIPVPRSSGSLPAWLFCCLVFSFTRLVHGFHKHFSSIISAFL